MQTTIQPDAGADAVSTAPPSNSRVGSILTQWLGFPRGWILFAIVAAVVIFTYSKLRPLSMDFWIGWSFFAVIFAGVFIFARAAWASPHEHASSMLGRFSIALRDIVRAKSTPAVIGIFFLLGMIFATDSTTAPALLHVQFPAAAGQVLYSDLKCARTLEARNAVPCVFSIGAQASGDEDIVADADDDWACAARTAKDVYAGPCAMVLRGATKAHIGIESDEFQAIFFPSVVASDVGFRNRLFQQHFLLYAKEAGVHTFILTFDVTGLTRSGTVATDRYYRTIDVRVAGENSGWKQIVASMDTFKSLAPIVLAIFAALGFIPDARRGGASSG